jgi:hypothetical protein
MGGLETAGGLRTGVKVRGKIQGEVFGGLIEIMEGLEAGKG